MPNYICITCGVQYAETAAPPEHCPICEDDRQYVNPAGQGWTTLDDLRRDRHNTFETLEPGLTAIRTDPQFAIGQQAHLIQTPVGNVLWDCISFIDQPTIDRVKALGGLTAITISHPHFYSSMVEWSRAFGGVPIYLHADIKEWVMRPDPAIHYWEGETLVINDHITAIRCGGHFPGSTALHWRDGAEGKGLLLTADTFFVAQDLQHVSFMHSFPNLIPLSASKVQHVVGAVEPFTFDRLYSAWPGKVIVSGAKAAVRRSAERYIAYITD